METEAGGVKDGGALPEKIVREYVLANGQKPAVRFKGVKLGELTEEVTIHFRHDNTKSHQTWHWRLYRTEGGNYVVQLSTTAQYNAKRVEVCKKPEQVLAWVKRQNPEDPKPSPKDWSPRIDFGVSEEQMKFLIAAEPKFEALFFRDVE